MGNKSGKPRSASEAAEPAAAVRDEDAPPPLFAADAAGLGDAAISLRQMRRGVRSRRRRRRGAASRLLRGGQGRHGLV